MAKGKIEILFDVPQRANGTIALAHGAGAGMRTDFMDYFAAGLAARKLRVARFEFPYMARRTATGKKGGSDREPVLRETWLQVIEQLGANRLVIGGKSMGGRMASLVADEARVAGLVCLGYPFHPPGKPERLRTAHLEKLKTPALILQGERDPFGTRAEVDGYQLSRKINLHWLSDGDHSLVPRKKSGRTQEQNWDEAVETIDAFVQRLK